RHSGILISPSAYPQSQRRCAGSGHSIAPVIPPYHHIACLTSVQKNDMLHPDGFWVEKWCQRSL
ncbi:MAG TPA: hypothetical protein VHV10_20180, partial [Ktedonobacteraceae bacterium]|nr:hypothetical protein [Ktedonobacteraceae bacterium]